MKRTKKNIIKFTCEDLRKFNPCYDPIKYLTEKKKYDIIDILKNKKISFEDKLWVILRTDFISERIMRLFAVWSYRQTLNFIKNPDKRSVECANVAERFANEEATKEELSAASSAARSAESAAWSAARSAESAAWSAARSAAWSAESAAWSAESAENAARSAAWSAAWSAESAARSAARSAQQEKLLEMILEGIKIGEVK